MIKTSAVSDESRREYLRMKQEQTINSNHCNATCFVYADNEETNKNVHSMFAKDDVIKIQNMEPEVISFPFVDVVDGISKDKKAKEEHKPTWNSHRAKWSMVSAAVHMKYMAQRKSNRMKDMALSSTGDISRSTADSNYYSNSDAVNEAGDSDTWGYLRKCRYLRGVDDDKELSIEEIFK